MKNASGNQTVPEGIFFEYHIKPHTMADKYHKKVLKYM